MGITLECVKGLVDLVCVEGANNIVCGLLCNTSFGWGGVLMFVDLG